MADLKVTKMEMKVNLQCSKCYRKIKKVLCRYPQIRDQVYNEKQNTVTITVVCCSPENIKKKIACKAGDTVECIKIIPDKKAAPAPDPIPPPAPPMPAQPPPPGMYLVGVCCCCCCYEGRPCCHGQGPMCYNGCGRPAYVSRCHEYLSEENAWGCIVM